MLQATFEQVTDYLAQHIVTFCEHQKIDADTTAAYRLVAGQGVWLTESINILIVQCVLYMIYNIFIIHVIYINVLCSVHVKYNVYLMHYAFTIIIIIILLFCMSSSEPSRYGEEVLVSKYVC